MTNCKSISRTISAALSLWAESELIIKTGSVLSSSRPLRLKSPKSRKMKLNLGIIIRPQDQATTNSFCCTVENAASEDKIPRGILSVARIGKWSEAEIQGE